MVAPEEAVLVQDLHLLHHVLVKFVSFERVVLMFIKMEYDKVLLDLLVFNKEPYTQNHHMATLSMVHNLPSIHQVRIAHYFHLSLT